MKHKLLCIVSLILVFTFSSLVSAQIPLVTGEWAPYTAEEMEGQGLVTEIVSAVFAHMGLEFSLRFFPWARCEAMVENGQAWASFPYSISEERREKYYFTDAIITSYSRFFYMKDRLPDFAWESFEDLKDYRVVGLIGWTDRILLNNAGVTTQDMTSVESAFQMLRAGRVDLLPENEVVGWGLLESLFPNDLTEFATAAKPLRETNYALLVSKTYPDSLSLVEAFNVSLKAIQETGQYNAILAKYNLQVGE